MIADAKQVAPNKPFFLYFALGAMHSPHHVPKEWADKYKGTFDAGWDAYREQVFEKQKQLGIVPAGRGAFAARSGRAGLGHAARRRAPRLRAHDGSVRRLSHPHRPLHRRADRVPEETRRIRQHADHADLRQRVERRGRPARLDQRVPILQQRRRHDRRAISPRSTRSAARSYFNHFPWGWTYAGNTPFRRWKRETYRGGIERSVHRALAQGHRGARRDPHAVRAHHRHGADGARRARHRAAGDDSRRDAVADRRRQPRAHVRRC